MTKEMLYNTSEHEKLAAECGARLLALLAADASTPSNLRWAIRHTLEAREDEAGLEMLRTVRDYLDGVEPPRRSGEQKQ